MSSYRKLFEIGKALIKETDLNKLLPLMMDQVIEQTHAQRGMITVLGEHGELLFETARHLDKKDIAQPEFEVSRTIIQSVLQNGRYVVHQNALGELGAPLSESIGRLRILSVACAPLRDGAESFGVIYIDNRDLTAIFDDETGRLLNEFAELIAVGVKKALKLRRLENETHSLKAETAKLRKQIARRRHLEELLAQSEGYDEFKGLKSSAMLEVFNRIEKVAGTDSAVLIVGETGTGKELVARVLRQKSKREKQPFVTLNCAAFVNPELLISELFGHAKGAFTGATKDRAGYFETADGGTIFLDEIAKSSLKFQTLLLRVLDTGQFSRLGETKTRHTDVRIISATNPNLQELIEDGQFLQDLYFRLAKYTIQIPPLRERREDIMELAEYFLQKFSQEHGRRVKVFDEKARALLLAYSWPGNVRDLMNAVNDAVISAESEIIYAEDLPISLPEEIGPKNAEEFNFKVAKQKVVENFEREFIINVLQRAHGNVTKAAELAGMHKKNFIEKKKKYGINEKDFMPGK